MATIEEMRNAARGLRERATRSLRMAEDLERAVDKLDGNSDGLWFEDDDEGRPWFFIGTESDWSKMLMTPKLARRIRAKLGAWLDVVDPDKPPA